LLHLQECISELRDEAKAMVSKQRGRTCRTRPANDDYDSEGSQQITFELLAHWLRERRLRTGLQDRPQNKSSTKHRRAGTEPEQPLLSDASFQTPFVRGEE
jgi:hypothetical protein